jgi:hypothetical protein
LTPQQKFFLNRLSRLVHQEQEWSQRVGGDDWRLHLIRRAIYSSYYDCVALGLTTEARAITPTNQVGHEAPTR